MQSASDSPNSGFPLVLAIGQFDGVHLGHQAVFGAAVESAKRRNGIPGCLTFSPHVAQLLNPANAPLLLADPETNQTLITHCGIQQIHTFPFTRELAAMGAEEFLVLLKMEFPKLAEIVVGQNFTFGKNRGGNRDTLPVLARQVGLDAHIVPHVELNGAPISSSRIRAAIHAGDLPLARAMLGRPFFLAGSVVHGRAVGRTMGFPTANIRPTLPIALPLASMRPGFIFTMDPIPARRLCPTRPIPPKPTSARWLKSTFRVFPAISMISTFPFPSPAACADTWPSPMPPPPPPRSPATPPRPWPSMRRNIHEHLLV